MSYDDFHEMNYDGQLINEDLKWSNQGSTWCIKSYTGWPLVANTE